VVQDTNITVRDIASKMGVGKDGGGSSELQRELDDARQKVKMLRERCEDLEDGKGGGAGKARDTTWDRERDRDRRDESLTTGRGRDPRAGRKTVEDFGAQRDDLDQRGKSSNSEAAAKARRQLGEMKMQIGLVYKDFDSVKKKCVIIDEVSKNSAADEAGLMRGDLVMEVEGDQVRNQASFTRMFTKLKPGDRVALRVERRSIMRTIPLVIGARGFSLKEVKRLAQLAKGDDDSRGSAGRDRGEDMSSIVGAGTGRDRRSAERDLSSNVVVAGRGRSRSRERVMGGGRDNSLGFDRDQRESSRGRGKERQRAPSPGDRKL
jgi:hypothetical protein